MAQRLGDILLQQGVVDAEKLAAALSDQKAFGGKLGRTLVDLGYVTEDQLMRGLADQLGLETVDLENTPVSEEALGMLTTTQCERYGVYPVKLDAEQKVLWIATAEPDHATLQEIAQATQLTLEPVLAPMSAIERAVRQHYYGEAKGHTARRKGDPLTMIPEDSGQPKPKKAPPGKLPSSADAVLHDPDAPPEPPAPEPAPAAPDEDPGEPIVLEQTAIVAAAPPPAAHKPAPAAPPPRPAPAAAAPQPQSGPESAESPEQLRAIAPGAAGAPDAVEELQRLVVRLEKIITAQGRAFRALVEILQEKGVVRRGELGSRTTKKP